MAEAFDVTPTTIANWHAAGMPKMGRSQFNLAECIRWKIETELAKRTITVSDDGLTKDEWELRKEAAVAQLKEYELQETLQHVVEHDRVDEILASYLEPLRAVILQIPGNWSLELLGLESKEQAHQILQQLVDDLLLRASHKDDLPAFKELDKIERKLEDEESSE